MDYKIFKKTVVGKRGKTVRRWYCYYTDSSGVQKQRVCKGCSNRSEAMAFVSNLPPLSSSGKTVREIARDMYLPGSDHVKRREAMGKSVLSLTMRESRIYLEDIIERWGGFDIERVDVAAVAAYLLDVKRSGSWKKRYVTVFNEVFDEAVWHGVSVQRPTFPHFVKKAQKKGVFTSEELKRLFVVENFASGSIDAETAYLFFLVSAYAGLRIGEARGLRPSQFLPAEKALVIDGFIRADGTRTNFNKKGSESDKKTRIVLLPNSVMEQVKRYVTERKIGDSEFIFSYKGLPIRKDFLNVIFKKAVKAAGIDTEGRKLTPHSLRFTYVTKMRRTLPIDTVRKLVGHTDEKMTEYYTRASFEDALAGIADTKDAVERLFD